jgi:hypothetical protein
MYGDVMAETDTVEQRRQANRDRLRRERHEQGFPDQVEDEAALEAIATIFVEADRIASGR